MQSAQQSNITKLYSSNQVYSHILSFLRSKGLKSKNTQTTYEADIRQFFSYMRNKPIEELTQSDLIFVNSDILDYQVYLSEEHRDEQGNAYKNTTVNRKLATIQSLYAFLKRNEYPVNVEAMKVDPLPDDSSPHGILSIEEAERMAELALTEREMGSQKRLLILLAVRTSLRKEALLSLKWSDIRKDTQNENLYIIEVNESSRQDKGKKISKEISSKMYNELLTIKNDKSDNDNIFDVNGKYVNDMINRLCVKMGIPEIRRIHFHSLKKTGINFVYEATGGDIYAASSQGSHSNISTTAKSYMKKQNNLAGVLMDSTIDNDAFDKLTYEEMRQLLSDTKNGVRSQLLIEATKIINQRESV